MLVLFMLLQCVCYSCKGCNDEGQGRGRAAVALEEEDAVEQPAHVVKRAASSKERFVHHLAVRWQSR